MCVVLLLLGVSLTIRTIATKRLYFRRLSLTYINGVWSSFQIYSFLELVAKYIVYEARALMHVQESLQNPYKN